MKKRIFVSLIASLLAFGGVAFASQPQDPSEPGIIKRTMGSRQATPVVVYKLVRNPIIDPNQGSMSANEAVIYDTSSDDGVTINYTTTSADGAFAGIIMGTIQTSDKSTTASAYDDEGGRNWGFALIHGRTTAKVKNGGYNGALLKDGIITSTDSGCITTAKIRTASTENLNVSTGDAVNLAFKEASATRGFFLDAPAAGDITADVYILAE